MTDSIPFDELPPAMDSVRRDQWGRYLVVPPSGGKPIGYTRATTVAKALDDGGGLAPWKAAMCASGIIMRRGLRARWEALLAEYGDPWYAGQEAKRQAKQLVEECSAIGGANDRREMGTSLHAITALVDLGKTPEHLTDETKRDIETYTNGLTKYSIDVIPGAVELTVVLDQDQVAGTFDRLAIVPGFELPLIADLKTGSSLDYAWNSIAVQLAIYSRGNAVYRQGSAKDGSQDSRAPMPSVNQDWGLVMALDVASPEPKLELWLVDLNAGWEAYSHSMWARQWRKQTPARSIEDFTPLPPAENVIPALEASVAVSKARKAAKERHPASETLGVIEVYQPLREWLQHRIDTIGANELARSVLINYWPAEVPTLRGEHAHSYQELCVIERLLDDIEKQYSITFPTARPGVPEDDDAEVARVVDLFPGATITKEQ